jgi:tetratricopeptide (TPR) repeat protein
MKPTLVHLICKFIPFIVLILYFNKLEGQIHDKFEIANTDSLKELISAQNKQERIDTYFKITDGYFVSQPDSCLKYAQLALNLAANYNDEAVIAEANLYMGKASYFKGNYTESIRHYLVSSDYYKKCNDFKKILLLDELLVFAYYYSGNYDVTLAHMDEIKTHMKYLPDSSYLAHIVIGLGYFYRYMEHYEQAIPYFLQYIEINKTNALPLGGLALCNGHLGYCYEYTGRLKKAIDCYQEDISMSDKLNMSTRSYLHLGSVYEKMDSLKKALDYYNLSIPFYEKYGNVHFKSLASLGLGRIYLRLGEYDKSRSELLNALSSAEWVYNNKLLYKTLNTEIKSFYTSLQIVEKFKEAISLKIIADIHFELYKLYDKQLLHNIALDEYILYHQTLDKLNNFEQIAAIEEIKDRYESEKKEQQIDVLSQEKAMGQLKLSQSRIIVFALGGLFLLAFIVAILIIRMIRVRSEQKSVVIQQKLLRSQMNPHFLYNSLASIQKYIITEDPDNASIYLSRFSKLVRNILDSSVEEFVRLEQEVNTIKYYLELQKVRYIEKMDFAIDVDDHLDIENIQVPPMLAQPFIENAIEHGIKHKQDKGLVSVRIKGNNNRVIFEVEDDGVGREKAQEILHQQKHQHKSMATSITQERINILNKKSRQKITLKIEDLKDSNMRTVGTRVRFEIPIA